MTSIPLLIFSLLGFVETPDLHTGDVVFHVSQSSQSEAIKDATNSEITHMGIIFIHEGKPHVYEAVSPSSKPRKHRVGLTPYPQWKNRGQGKRIWVKRLATHRAGLTKTIQSKMYQAGMRHKGKRYDRLFQWNKKRIYCSELVYDIYKRGAGIELGTVQRVRDLNLGAPSVQRLIQARLGKNLNQDERIITPISIFNDSRLYTVIEP